MRKLAIGLCVLLLLGGGAYTVFSRTRTSGTVSQPTPIPEARTTDAVVASAQVMPILYAELSAATGGLVARILVKEGDHVDGGAVLAQLDDTAQRARVAAREAALAQAQANYAKVQQGATPDEIRAAEASVTQAQAQLRQTIGSVTATDIKAAEAQVQQAPHP